MNGGNSRPERRRLISGEYAANHAFCGERASDLLQHLFRVIGRDPRQFPEEPSGRWASNLSHSNQTVGRRLLQPPLPTRNHHRGALEPFSKVKLIEPKALAQRSNPPRPGRQRRGHELTGAGHSCLQDNKSRHTLRCAHQPVRPRHGRRCVTSSHPRQGESRNG